MSRRKAFTLRVEIGIHSVDYPAKGGCHSGNVALSVHALSSHAVTKPARSPFHFHENFIFEKVIDCVSTLTQIQEHLNNELLKMELIQWSSHHAGKPTIIAHFRTKLSNLLFPTLRKRDLISGGRVKLLMEPAENFEGAAGPKVEVSTRMALEERSAHVETSEIPTSVSGYCPRAVKLKPTGCLCHASDQFRWETGTRSKKATDFQLGWSHSFKNISCNECCICNSYSGYFHPKPYFGWRSCSCRRSCEDKAESRSRNTQTQFSPASSSEGHPATFKFEGEEVEKPIPHRQLFYENLDFFYRQLRSKKNNLNCYE